MGSHRLNRIRIDGVRNLTGVELADLRGVNVLYGSNGSGKTSVLEAIHLLAMARSFRGSIKSLISHGKAEVLVFGQLKPGNLPLGVQRGSDGEVVIKAAGKQLRTVAELVEYLPVQVINADSFSLLTGSPTARRQYLDWGVFHVEHRFYEQWQRFQRCIKQRNKLLRHGKIRPQELAVWTRDLAQSGEALTAFRKDYFERLQPAFRAIMAALAPGLGELELRFRQGWDRQQDFPQALAASEATDREQGYTHVGPQRADIRVMCDGHLAAETLSRGQQKLVVCGLKLAQGQLMQAAGKGQCTYLVDDLPSELDSTHARLVCEMLAGMQAQVFITCVDREDLEAVWPAQQRDALGMFHVEQGKVTPQPVAGTTENKNYD